MTRAYSNRVRNGLRKKLHPSVFRTGPKFHALLAHLLGVTGWTNPDVLSLAITVDGHLIGDGNYLGAVVDLHDNIRRMREQGILTEAEYLYLCRMTHRRKLYPTLTSHY